MTGDERQGLQTPASGPRKTAWMLTFADLLSLMLTFFVLLYSMNTLKQGKWSELVESLSQRLNPRSEIQDFTIVRDLGIERIDEKPGADLDYLYAIFVDKVEGTPELKGLSLRKLDDRLVISLSADTMFQPGVAALKFTSITTLDTIVSLVGNVNNQVDVVGHTDPEPVSGETYPSNWELSLARATAIAHTLRSTGYPYDIEVFGLADSRFDEITDALTAAKRTEFSRRVDIVVRENLSRR